MRFAGACLGSALLLAGAAQTQRLELRAELMGQAPPAPAASPPPSAPPVQSAAPSAAQPDLTAVKADFIPGEKTVFYDDFTDMDGDEPPPHWKVRGGSVVLKVAPGVRQLTTDTGLIDLSKRRAEAVKAVLESQFGIGAGRLTTDGLGAGKPIGANDTPTGRAQNRRVEFVKM